MSCYRLYFCLVITSLLCGSSVSHALLVAQHLTDNESLNLIEYRNPHQDGFSHSTGDHFQELRQGEDNLGTGLLDESLEGSDNLGLILKGKDSSPFFAAQDVDNPANPDGQATAHWRFDVSGYSELSFSLDIAAMGDFESSDWFRWDYSIDDQFLQPLFDFQVEDAGQQSYQLASGALITLNDPLVLVASGTTVTPTLHRLSNHFQTFMADLIGSGNQLDLFFTAQQNGGSEVFAFRNLLIHGEAPQDSESAKVPTPSSFSLLLLGVMMSGVLSKATAVRSRKFQNG